MHGAGEGVEIGWVGEQMPSRPSSIWSTMPPTALATTGRPFHIASVTVRPKPSSRLF